MTAYSAEAAPVITSGPAEPLSLSTDRAALAEALVTTGLVPIDRSWPAWGGVVLEGRGDHLIVTGSNGDTTIQVRVPDADTMHGRVLLDRVELTKLLSALVKGHRKKDLAGMPVTVDATDPDKPVLELAGYAVPLTALPMDGFPPVQRELATVARLDREHFTSQAVRVLRAVTADAALPMLSGLHLDVLDGAITLAGTDRFRLATTRVPAITVLTDTTRGGAIVEGGLLAKFLKRLTADRITVGWHLSASTDPAQPLPPTVSLSCGDTTLVTTSVSAHYLDYQHVLPTGSQGTAVVDREWMLSETQRAAAVLTAKKETPGRVAVLLDPLAVRITPVLDDRGDQVSAPGRVAVVTGITEPTEYLFQPEYLVDALQSFGEEMITLHPTGNTEQPLVFTDTPSELLDPMAFRHLLMPMRNPEA